MGADMQKGFFFARKMETDVWWCIAELCFGDPHPSAKKYIAPRTNTGRLRKQFSIRDS